MSQDELDHERAPNAQEHAGARRSKRELDGRVGPSFAQHANRESGNEACQHKQHDASDQRHSNLATTTGATCTTRSFAMRGIVADGVGL